MDALGLGFEVALGVGGGLLCTALFHASYDAANNPRWGRFIVVTTGALCLFAAVELLFGEFDALHLSGGFAFLLSFAVGACIWRPRRKPSP
jgi:hypothetical protein